MHSVFSNGSLLSNIHHCEYTGLMIYSNRGVQKTVIIGDYEPLGMTIWYNTELLANILALREVRKETRVTMNTDIVAAMVVHDRGDKQKIIVFEK